MNKNQRLSDKQMRWVMEQFNNAPHGKVLPLFICVGGSRLYNINTDSSDYDVYAVHLDDSEKVLSGEPLLETINKENTELNISLQSFEFNKALKMAINNNPNLIEVFLAPPLYQDATYEPSNSYARALVKESISKQVTLPFISMVNGNLQKYILDENTYFNKQPKRLLAMLNQLLRCCSYVDSVFDTPDSNALCDKYLNTTEKKIVAELLKEKQEGRDESSVKDLAVGLIKTFIDKINKVKVLSKLPDYTDNRARAQEIILLTRLFQLRDNEKLKRLIVQK
jgi:predicted nucleotidyltransferase